MVARVTWDVGQKHITKEEEEAEEVVDANIRAKSTPAPIPVTPLRNHFIQRRKY